MEFKKNKESQSQQAVGYSLSLKLGTNKKYRSELWGIKPNLSNKKLWGGLITAIVLVLIASSTILAAGNSTAINSEILNNTLENIFEAVSQIEVWINTFIDIKQKEDTAEVLLYLDDGTSLSNQEIEFYLNNSLIDSQLTDSEGYARLIFNPNISPGTYFFKAEFKGNPSLYLNPSFAEEQIEIIRLNETYTNTTILNETNQTLFTINTDKKIYMQNETINIFGEYAIEGEKAEINLTIEFNETLIYSALISSINGSYAYFLPANFKDGGDYLVRVSAGSLSAETSFYFTFNESFLDLGNMICKEFEENVLWTGKYTNKQQGATNYQIWHPKHNCSELNTSNCFLKNAAVKARFLYFGDTNELGEGYIQISEPDESICDNPEKGNYFQYLAYETLKGENESFDQYCGKNKKAREKEKCDIGIPEYKNYAACYGIKSYGSQHMIVDAFEIRYDLCMKEGGANEN